MNISKTLTEVGAGVLAYTQLPGSWGWSNAGLITDGDQSLLVDTLFDRKLTLEMLSAMREAAPAASRIGTVVNTHGNGDHCFGNSVVSGAQIIGSSGCVEDLAAAPPRRNALLMRASKLLLATGGAGRILARGCSALGLRTLAWISDAAPFALPLFEDFEFVGNEVVLPDRVFEGRLSLSVGDKRVELWEVGPAHTLGDTVVHVPEEGVLFTGDILFKDAVTDLSGLRETLEYLEWLTAEARTRYDVGLTVDEAARDLEPDAYANWLDAERIFVNLHTLYRDFSGEPKPPEILEMFAGMARLAEYRAR
jgi:glyoxylase-like metal-dependent hydrolase (beta-lactamase superfamily II)